MGRIFGRSYRGLWCRAAILIVGVGGCAGPAAAATFTTIYRFCSKANCTDGSTPFAPVIIDKSGNLYGTTHEGGVPPGNGTAFMLTPQGAGRPWKEKILFNFCSVFDCEEGAYPDTGVIMDEKGDLFGISTGPGNGVVFRLTPNAARTHWTASVIYYFCSQPNCADGGQPIAPLIMDRSGNLFGTTSFGGGGMGNPEGPCISEPDGTTPYCGTVFALKPNADKTAWQLQTLHSFCSRENCADGLLPRAPLIMDKSGNLFGTTSLGGTRSVRNYRGGTVFELSPGGPRSEYREKVITSFCDCRPNGNDPEAGLVSDAKGNLYGTTVSGGILGNGAVFELKPNSSRTQWTKTILYSFCSGGDFGCPDGTEPSAGLVIDKDGNLYGTTVAGGAAPAPGYGTVFELSPNAARTHWTEQVLHRFCEQKNCPDGSSPWAGLTYAGVPGALYDGKSPLYGTTTGNNPGQLDLHGTVFMIKP